MSCDSGEGFFITIVTFPAFAVSVFFLKRSWPLGSAWSESFSPPPPALWLGALAAGALAGGADEELLDFDPPPPQPATTSAPAASTAATAIGLRLADIQRHRVLRARGRCVLVVLEDREEGVLAGLDARQRHVEGALAAHAEHRAHPHHPLLRRVDVDVPVPVARDVVLAVERARELEVLRRHRQVEPAVHGGPRLRRQDPDRRLCGALLARDRLERVRRLV